MRISDWSSDVCSSDLLSLTTAGPDAHYLELVTRDTALMLLNRSPQGLDYWLGEILKLADPAAHGRLKGELVKIVEEPRGSDISQPFVIRRMDVVPGSQIGRASCRERVCQYV